MSDLWNWNFFVNFVTFKSFFHTKSNINLTPVTGWPAEGPVPQIRFVEPGKRRQETPKKVTSTDTREGVQNQNGCEEPLTTGDSGQE